MPAHFQIRLDTTAPQGSIFELAGGASSVADQDVSFVLSTTDADTTGYQVKIWGDVDPAYNVGIQDTEAASDWLGYGTITALRLSDGAGLKNLHAVIRDDVGNVTATLNDSVTLDTSAPVITITVDPDRTKISKVDPWDETNFTFAADSDLSEWKVKVVPDFGATHDQGTDLATAGGSTDTTGGALAADAPQVVKIMGADLQTTVGPDGDYILKVFGREAGAGVWSL